MVLLQGASFLLRQVNSLLHKNIAFKLKRMSPHHVVCEVRHFSTKYFPQKSIPEILISTNKLQIELLLQENHKICDDSNVESS